LVEIKKDPHRASLIFNVGTSSVIARTLKLLALISINVQEIKQAYIAHKHALLVAKNLKLLIKGFPNSKLATYNPGYPLALVSLGRKEGLLQLPLLTLCGCLPGKIKSGDVFVGKTRKNLGLNG
jgi:hypothetical protein